ncbi:alkaline ceramidase ydc1 [Coemansia sp. RSA 988]|nr:alkaline ceramidase ydc1 [Coemansia sp. RSA 988]
MEENYAVSDYIAEFWNTLTNITLITMAVLGICSSVRYGHGKRVTAMYTGLLVVSCGSALFHMTLKYTTQLLDELPMLYTCATALYALIEIDREIRFGLMLPTLLALFQAAVTVVYIFWIPNPAFHQTAFAVTTIGTVFYAYKRFVTLNPCKETRRVLIKLRLLADIGMWGGFLLWNIDTIFCERLRSYRSYVGVPLDAILQLHGWWHIMTAYGSTYNIISVHIVRLARRGLDKQFMVHYYMGVFPYVGEAHSIKSD